MADLGVGLKQKVEILKALVKGAEILILDEPTAVLTPQETQELFVELKRLKEDGHAIIFISHKLEEVMKLCDRVTVLRQGIPSAPMIENLDATKISRMMVGRDVVLKIEKEPVPHRKSWWRSGPNYPMKMPCVVDEGDVSIRAGEIVGIAGVEGNGQNEVAEIITGMLPYSIGSVSQRQEIRQVRPADAGHGSRPYLRRPYELRLCRQPVGEENIMSDRLNRKRVPLRPLHQPEKDQRLGGW